MRVELASCAGLDELSARAAELLFGEAQAAVSARGAFHLAISGGSTPQGLFTLLGGEPAGRLPASRTRVFWCDERLVPPDHPWSNFGLARRLWFEPAGFPAANLHPVPVELSRDRAAEKYEEILSSYLLPATPAPGDRPQETPGDRPRDKSLIDKENSSQPGGDRPAAETFDLCLLGMGADGHVASLFPGSPALAEQRRLVRGARPPGYAAPAVDRVTLTLPAINASRVVAVLVAGEQKAALVDRILTGQSEVAALPAARVRAAERMYWLLAPSQG